MQPHEAIALALLALQPSRNDMKIAHHRAAVAEKLATLRARGIPLPGLELRETPVGVRSRDVDEFVGRLLIVRKAVYESPIRLTESGLELLSEVVREALERDVESAADTRSAAEILGLDLSQLPAPSLKSHLLPVEGAAEVPFVGRFSR